MRYSNYNYYLQKEPSFRPQNLETEDILEQTRRNLQNFIFNLKNTEIPTYDGSKWDNNNANTIKSYGRPICTEPNNLRFQVNPKKSYGTLNKNSYDLTNPTLPRTTNQTMKLRAQSKRNQNRLIIKNFEPTTEEQSLKSHIYDIPREDQKLIREKPIDSIDTQQKTEIIGNNENLNQIKKENNLNIYQSEDKNNSFQILYEQMQKERDELNKIIAGLQEEKKILIKEKEDYLLERETTLKEKIQKQKDIELINLGKIHIEKDEIQRQNDKINLENEYLQKENDKINKENQDIQKKNESIIKEKEEIQKINDKLVKEKEEIKKQNEKIIKDKEDAQKQNEKIKEEKEKMKIEKEKIIKEKEEIQKENLTLKEQIKKTVSSNRFKKTLQISVRREFKYEPCSPIQKKFLQNLTIESDNKSFHSDKKPTQLSINTNVNEFSFCQDKSDKKVVLKKDRTKCFSLKPPAKPLLQRKKVIALTLISDNKETKDKLSSEIKYLKTKVKDLTKVKKDLTTLQTEKNQINAENETLKKEKEQINKKQCQIIDSLKKELENKNGIIAQYEKEKDDYVNDKQDMEEEMILLNQEITMLRSEKENYQSPEELGKTIRELERNKKDLELKIAQLTGENDIIKTDLHKVQSQLKSLQEQPPMVSMNEDLETENEELKKTVSSLEYRLQKNDESVNLLNEQIQKLINLQKEEKEKNVSLTAEIEKLKTSKTENPESPEAVKKTKEEITKLKSQLIVAKRKGELYEKTAKDLQTQNEKLKKDLEEKTKEENIKKEKITEIIEKGYDENDDIESLKQKNLLLRTELKDKEQTITQAKSVISKAKSFDECSQKFNIMLNDYTPKNTAQQNAFETLKILFGIKEIKESTPSDFKVPTKEEKQGERGSGKRPAKIADFLSKITKK